MNSLVSGIYQRFPALSHRHYRGFFYAQLVSLIGTWMQMATVPWLINQQTHSPYMVGLVNALSTLPILALTIFAGVFADRRSKKTILVFTQTLLLVNALLFGLLSSQGFLNVGWIVRQ
jgi:MFS family permease